MTTSVTDDVTDWPLPNNILGYATGYMQQKDCHGLG